MKRTLKELRQTFIDYICGSGKIITDEDKYHSMLDYFINNLSCEDMLNKIKIKKAEAKERETKARAENFFRDVDYDLSQIRNLLYLQNAI